MARIYKDLKIVYHGYNLSCKSNALTVNYEVDEKDQTTFCDSTMLTFPGLMKVNAEVDGFMDLDSLANGAVEALINSEVGSTTAKAFSATTGNSAGDAGFFFEAYMIGSPYLSGSVGDLHEFKMRLANGRSSSSSSGRLVRGTVLQGLTANTSASSNTASQQLGAVASGQTIYAAIHVVSTDATSIAFTLRSADNSGMTSSTTQASFTSVTGVTSEIKSVAGPITDDYWDIAWTRTGGTTFTALMVVGILTD